MTLLLLLRHAYVGVRLRVRVINVKYAENPFQQMDIYMYWSAVCKVAYSKHAVTI